MKRNNGVDALDAPKKRRSTVKRQHSTERFLQNLPCYKLTPKLPRCRDCGRSAAARSRDALAVRADDDLCRFIAFRKLKYNEEGVLEVNGFADPRLDPKEADICLWSSNLKEVPVDLSLETSKFLLGQVGHKFCELFQQEMEACFEHMSEDTTIAWRQAVRGVREMCDVCQTTLFNYHWVCTSCGFVVCLDCYKCKKRGSGTLQTTTKDKDDAGWFMCSVTKEPHIQSRLMITQIIPGDCFNKLVRQMHGICALLGIPLDCECPLSQESRFRKIKDKLEFIYPVTVDADTLTSNGNNHERDNSGHLPVKLTIKDIEPMVTQLEGEISDAEPNAYRISFVKQCLSSEQTHTGDNSVFVPLDDTSDGDVQRENQNYSVAWAGTVNESGGQPSHRPLEADEANAVEDSSITAKPSPPLVTYSENGRFKPSPPLDSKTLGLIIKQILKFDKDSGVFSSNQCPMASDEEAAAPMPKIPEYVIIQRDLIQQFLIGFLGDFELLNSEHNTNDLFVDVNTRRCNMHSKESQQQFRKGERTMTLATSSAMYPGLAHEWLCNGKLLRLLDPLSRHNYQTFHDQWERGQPVMVSSVSGAMNMELWTPQSFDRDFGEQPSDLVNCLNGKIVKGYSMHVFWAGFQSIDDRLLDEHKCPMPLKLKDWPPGDDFAELMPSRFDDLMKSLPLAEYTRRSGRLNLASRLPGFFVRPDLGPKMYSAYGSAMNPKKGTTSLHLDISDAVNVMVYVGTPADETREQYNRKVLESIGIDDCDAQTRRRINEREDLPGALWHIYHAQDADKIRSFLRGIDRERGNNIKPNHDPIHDQKWYLDANMRKRLLQEYQVEGYSIVQCSGDAIFIPAGAPHQVLNLHNCIKVAEDFVSPENISYCFQLTNEFRYLTKTHSNHEDKLQIKNIVYHTVKDAVSTIANPLIIMADNQRPANTVKVGND
ncbi:lysine-specific demethylase 3A [Anopheles bellator]|uniref:lysine-specific demethylase 3A n=1 Tax=Anopheles bellator TaxID=139047 RepID=UPI002648A3FC|nr:lysine-specific demethylase 3A [Anopheles bellator]